MSRQGGRGARRHGGPNAGAGSQGFYSSDGTAGYGTPVSWLERAPWNGGTPPPRCLGSACDLERRAICGRSPCRARAEVKAGDAGEESGRAIDGFR